MYKTENIALGYKVFVSKYFQILSILELVFHADPFLIAYAIEIITHVRVKTKSDFMCKESFYKCFLSKNFLD